MAGELLALFPLQAVLFPDSSLPLHIFEERYKILINECIAGKSEFGISYGSDDNVSSVGCTALVASVTQRYNDGRMDIVVKGQRRFQLTKSFDNLAPYLVGNVEFVDEPEEALDIGLAAQTVGLFEKLVAIVYRDKGQRPTLNPDTGGVSFTIAQKAGLDLKQRQRILELTSENERLRLLKAYLIDVIPKLERLEEVERVIRGDGYL